MSDSGSTDRTVEIASRYADKVVEYGSFPRNTSRGRNLGATVAKGEFFVFIDADVTAVNINEFFAKAFDAFECDCKLVAITMRIEVQEKVRTWADGLSYRVANASTYMINNILFLGLGSGELQMVRADAFRSAHGYNERLNLSEDIEFYGRLARIGRVRMVSGLLVEHPGRRPHTIGWPKLWRQWIVNTLSIRLFGFTWDNEWIPIR